MNTKAIMFGKNNNITLFAILVLLIISCNNSEKELEKENRRLQNELELYKDIENNRQKAVQHADTRTFRMENEREILSILFDTETFDIEERAVWSPNFEERLNFPISYDGFCYTKVDKVLLYKDELQRAVVVFGTYELMDGGQSNNGHVTAPLLSLGFFTQRNSDGWELSSFKKNFVYHGSWGKMGDVEMKQVGKQKFVLDLSWAYSNMGETQAWTSYYSIPSFNVIFGLTTSSSFTGFEDNDGKAYAYDTKLIIKPSSKEYFDIIAETTGTKPNDIKNEDSGEYETTITSANDDHIFYYDEHAGVYVEYKKMPN